MRGLKTGLASNGDTSPLHSGYWYHSQKDRWATVRRLQWRGYGKGDEGPAGGREAAWTCQLHIGDVSTYASATWSTAESKRGFSELGQHIPGFNSSGRQMPIFRILLLLDFYTPLSQNRTIYIIYYNTLMVVSFGNSAINDLYTADTPRA
jgi:hypothetical protein